MPLPLTQIQPHPCNLTQVAASESQNNVLCYDEPLADNTATDTKIQPHPLSLTQATPTVPESQNVVLCYDEPLAHNPATDTNSTSSLQFDTSCSTRVTEQCPLL